MAFPFGGHPTLERYLAMARDSGCVVKTGVAVSSSGQPVSTFLVENPNGRHLIVDGTLGSEHLTPSTVARYDRILMLNSGFSKVD
jgi:hypothetical protein